MIGLGEPCQLVREHADGAAWQKAACSHNQAAGVLHVCEQAVERHEGAERWKQRQQAEECDAGGRSGDVVVVEGLDAADQDFAPVGGSGPD